MIIVLRHTKGELVLHNIKEIKSYKRKIGCLGHYCNEHVYVVQNKENKWEMYNSNFKAIDENNKSSAYSILNNKAIKNEYENASPIISYRGIVGWVIRYEKQRYDCLDRFFRVAIPCQYTKNFHDVVPGIAVAKDEKGYYSF